MIDDVILECSQLRREYRSSIGSQDVLVFGDSRLTVDRQCGSGINAENLAEKYGISCEEPKWYTN
jgi:hypothetical protein